MNENIFSNILSQVKIQNISILQQIWYFISSHQNRKTQFSILKSVKYLFFDKKYFEAKEILDSIKYEKIPNEYKVIIIKLKMALYFRLGKLHDIKKLIEDYNDIFDTYYLHKKATFMFSSARMYWWTNFSEKLENSPYPYYSFEEVKNILEKSIEETDESHSEIVSRVLKYTHTNVFLLRSAVDEKDTDLVLEVIANILLKLGLNSEESLYLKTKDLIAAQLITDKDISEQKKEYEVFLSSFNLEEFNSNFSPNKKYRHLALWLSIEWLLQASGFFHASIYARRNATESFLSMGSINDKHYLSAMIEKGDMNGAKNYIRSQRQVKSTDKYFLAYIALLQGKKTEYIDLTKEIYKSYSVELDKYLTDKNLAIVGPAMVEDNGKLIDESDVVIRMNTCGETPSNTKSFGTKTDVVSYNIERLARFKSKGDMKLLPNIKFGLVKSDRFIEGIYGLEKVAIIKHDFASCMLPGTWLVHAPMLIPFLYAFNTSGITLFNANFFISDPENTYSKDYNRKVSFRSLAFMDNHIVGFRFAKQMYASGVFKADNTAKKILDMSEYEYARSMESLYQPERLTDDKY